MSEWIPVGLVAAFTAYALLLRHFNIFPRRPTYQAERSYDGLTIGMERWTSGILRSADTLTIYAKGNFKGKRVKSIILPFIQTSNNKEMPVGNVISWLNHYLGLESNVTLPADDPKLIGLVDDLYGEMRIPRLK